MTRKIEMFTTVWGDWHLNALEMATLPSLLAPNNIPQMSIGNEIKYTIYTMASDHARVEAMSVLKSVSTHIEVDVVSDPDRTEIDINEHLPWWHRLIENARMNGAIACAIHPDAVWSDGSLATALGAVVAGKAGFLVPNYRIVSETGVPEMRRRYCAGEGQALVMTGVQLAEIYRDHIHPLCISQFPNVRPSTPGPDRYWTVPNEGITGRIFNRPMIILDTRRVELNERLFAVGELKMDEIEIGSDSDSFLALNLTPLGKDLGTLSFNHGTDLVNPARWSVGELWESSINEEFARMPLRLSWVQDRSDVNWTTTEQSVAVEYAETLGYRTWSRLVRALDEAGCNRVGDLVAVALHVTNISRTIGDTDRLSIVAPPDPLIDDVTSIEFDRLVAAGNESELTAKLLSMIVAGPNLRQVSGGEVVVSVD